MGQGLSILTSGGLFVTTIFLVIMGVLLVSASYKVQDAPDFNSNGQLQSINDKLRLAYIFIFIAAGLPFVLSILYSGHESFFGDYLEKWYGVLPSIFYIAAVVLLVIGSIYAYLALYDLNVPDLSSEEFKPQSFIWVSLLMGLFGFMGLIGTGSGRLGYNAVKSRTNERLNVAEDKIKDTHATVKQTARDIKDKAMDAKMKVQSSLNSTLTSAKQSLDKVDRNLNTLNVRNPLKSNMDCLNDLNRATSIPTFGSRLQ